MTTENPRLCPKGCGAILMEDEPDGPCYECLARDTILAQRVRSLTERAAKALDTGQGITPIEEDCNGAPHGTRDYDGRALAFHVTQGVREYRITVEDITLEENEEGDNE